MWRSTRQPVHSTGITHWQSPSFFAYFSANSSPPGLLGEMLSGKSGLDITAGLPGESLPIREVTVIHQGVGALNTIGFSWITSPASTELETVRT